MDNWVTNIVESMGYFGVALLMALENIFPPVPSELVMPLAGFTSAKGDLNIWLVIAIGGIGTLVGTLPWYGLARWLHKDRFYDWIDRHGHWLTVERSELERAERWFGKHSRLVVALARVVPGVRTLISVPAGFCRMPLWEYLLFSAIGTLVWTGGLAYLGHALGKNYTAVSQYLGPITWGVLGVLLAIYLFRLVRMRRRSHRRREPAEHHA